MSGAELNGPPEGAEVNGPPGEPVPNVVPAAQESSPVAEREGGGAAKLNGPPVPDTEVVPAVQESSTDNPGGEAEDVSSNEEDEVVERKCGSDQEELLPIPPPVPKSGITILAHKLWIGNLDRRLTEQNILRFVMKYGTIASFRYLFKTGPERPEQRDYVFVEYTTREEAERAKTALDGKKALGKRIIVDWARQDQGAAKKNQHTVSETWDASSVSETLDKTASTSAKIAALEAKLKQMEERGNVPLAKRQRLSSSVKIQQARRQTGHTKLPLKNRQRQSTRQSRQTFLHIKH